MVTVNKTRNVLFVAQDEGIRLSLLRFDSAKGTVSVASLPRNLEVTHKGKTRTLTGHKAYGGLLYLKEALESSLDIKIHNYMVLPSGTLSEVVDEIGGIEYNITAALYQKDELGAEEVNIQSGNQTLNGQQVAGYYIYRWSGANNILVKRTEMTCAIIEKMATEEIAPSIESIYKGAVNTTDTDINAQLIINLVSNSQAYVDSSPTAIAVPVQVQVKNSVATLTEDTAKLLANTFCE